MELRWYQDESVNIGLETIKDRDAHPIIAIPTGAGKSLIGTTIADRYIKETKRDVLFVSHVKEILQQLNKSLVTCTDNKIGLYSSGLKSKTIEEITVAGIQSIWKKPELFSNVGLVIIDEAHLVNDLNSGMYRTLFNNLRDVNYLGLTATPYRKRGYLHIGEETLFNCMPYDLTNHTNFKRLVREKYLSTLFTRSTDFKLDTLGIKTTAGDFDNKQMNDRLNRMEITIQAAKEIVKFGVNFKKWLVFCININHAEVVALMLNTMGIKTKAVHSEMKEDRDEVLEQYRSGELQCLTNVDVLTTGIDVPDIDFISMLRPTQSPIIYVQSVGRGLRVARDKYGNITKDRCLVLDFAGNVARLGPIDNIQIEQKGKPKKGGDPITKECPQCKCIYHPLVKECDNCGYKFTFKEKITASSSELSIVKEIKMQWVKVTNAELVRHKKKGAPDSVKIEMISGLRKYNKWFAIGSEFEQVRRKSRYELKQFVEGDIDNMTIEEILVSQTKNIKQIHVDLSEKYPHVLSWDIE